MSDPTLADPEWAVTLFSFTSELVRGERRPDDLVDAVLSAGLARALEVDAPQHFASYPAFDKAELDATRAVLDRHGARLSLLGIYNDFAIHPDRYLDIDESTAYVARQLEATAALGGIAARIMFDIPVELLERLAPHADRTGVALLQEVQGGARPDGEAFERQLAALDRIGSPHLGFVFDLSACMPALPVTYLEELRRQGVPEDTVKLLDAEWASEDLGQLRSRVDALTAGASLNSAAQVRLGMPFGRFGRTRVSDWREFLPRFSAIHLKFWDLEDADRRVSRPIADVRREFGAIGYEGVVTSEWGGHEWLTDDPFAITRAHRALFDGAIA